MAAAFACIESAIDPVIDRERRRLVATAQARDVANRDVVRAASPEGLLQACFQFGPAAQVATHIRTALALPRAVEASE